ncbi:MAG TPA: OmpA family protein [Burkholderiaceae bacterium]|nr:OmpA family protein [Burkholderiaceae bacterium]
MSLNQMYSNNPIKIAFIASIYASFFFISGCASKPEVATPTPPKAVIAIDQTPRGVQIPLPNTVLFQFGKSDLNTAAADPYLDKIASLIKSKSNKPVAVEGHTDNVGTLPANQQLSEARAKIVRDALQARGVPADRLKAEGFAFQRPVVSNSNEEGRAMNRRVEIIILDEKVENITAGEPANAFESAFAKLKAMVDAGLVKPL